MTPSKLVYRGVTYYWRTNAAVVLGVATAVAVLSGALLVGDSVRGSLRDLVLQRLGAADQALVSTTFFRESLADELRTDADFPSRFDGVAPLTIVPGFVTVQSTRRRASQVLIYGVDQRFWRFHQVSGISGPADREALVSPALARALEAQADDTLLVRVQRPSEIPLESLFGQRDAVGRTMRLTVGLPIPPGQLGEFSLQPQQGDVRAIFVPLARLQRDLEVEGRVNALLVSTRAGDAETDDRLLRDLTRRHARLEDVGLELRVFEGRQAFALESDAGLLTDDQVTIARQALLETGMSGQAVFTYLANSLRAGDREIPYSLVTARDLSLVRLKADATTDARAVSKDVVPGLGRTVPPIVLNDWAARDLGVSPGDPVSMEFFVWEEPGRVITRTAEFRAAGVVPVDPADRDLTPDYPGITESPTLEDWSPPFPIDLRRVRAVDEAYWQGYRTTPKAFIPIEVGQQLWRSRYGAVTSLLISPDPARSLADAQQAYAERLRASLDPFAMGLAVRDVRADSLGASRGATDFGEYFVYFSFFLVVSALVLAVLFFRLSVEQRAREVGLLRAVGFRPAQVRRLFLAEGLVLSLLGSLVGVLGGVAYAWVMMTGLRTWWVDAVGTTALALHVSASSLIAGAVAGVVAAMACIWWTLRSLARVSDRGLLAGQLASDSSRGPSGRRCGSWALAAAGVFAVTGVALLGAGLAGLIGRTGAFFGAGSALLAACLTLFAAGLRRTPTRVLGGRGWRAVGRLGARNATYRPGRSLLSIAVVASATFMLISVDAFRREESSIAGGLRSGLGGYALIVESQLPLVHDPNTREGREALGLSAVGDVTIEPFRLRPGDDASCLNLYEPRNPRILAASDRFMQAGRFGFQASLASSDAERANPWLLLARDEPDGAIPVAADANSITYVLHRRLGDVLTMPYGDGEIRVRLVAALADSIFQRELVMSEANFRRLFPTQEGYQFLLVEVAPENLEATANAIEDALTDFGADATPTAERLAEFHRVENAYLSTFQALGGLGLVLGTVGLGAVLLRNVSERRRELALLRALGYRPVHFSVMVVAENVWLLAGGLVAGTVCALLAIAPIVWERGGRLPAASMALLLGGVLLVGLLASLGATAAALRSPLLSALRAE